MNEIKSIQVHKEPIFKEIKFRSFLPVASLKKQEEIRVKMQETGYLKRMDKDGQMVFMVVTSNKPMAVLLEEIETLTEMRWAFYEVWGVEPEKITWKHTKRRKNEKAKNNV